MRLTKKKVDEILTVILTEEGLPLVDQLWGRQNVSEFDLAKKTKKDIKVIRKMLYLLYNHNLVSFTRKKDKQKGWYIYYWTLLPEHIKFNYLKRKRHLLEQLEARLDEEQKELFFVCPSTCVRLNFDQAMDFEFHCPECGDLIIQDDSEKHITALEKQIKTLKQELVALEVKRKIKRKVVKTKKKTVKKRVNARQRKKTPVKEKKKTVTKKVVKAKKTTVKIPKKNKIAVKKKVKRKTKK
jgi:transcription initiation factor TFIIE subunit alpha